MTQALQLLTYVIAVIAWLCIALPHIATPGWQDDAGFHHGEPDLRSFHDGEV